MLWFMKDASAIFLLQLRQNSLILRVILLADFQGNVACIHHTNYHQTFTPAATVNLTL